MTGVVDEVVMVDDIEPTGMRVNVPGVDHGDAITILGDAVVEDVPTVTGVHVYAYLIVRDIVCMEGAMSAGDTDAIAVANDDVSRNNCPM